MFATSTYIVSTQFLKNDSVESMHGCLQNQFWWTRKTWDGSEVFTYFQAICTLQLQRTISVRIKNKNGGMGIPQVRSLVAFAKAYLRPAALSMYSFSNLSEYHRKW